MTQVRLYIQDVILGLPAAALILGVGLFLTLRLGCPHLGLFPRAVGGIDNLIDWDSKSPEVTLMKYMEDKTAKEDKVFDDPTLMKTPVVRNGKQATVGYCPEIWETWE